METSEFKQLVLENADEDQLIAFCERFASVHNCHADEVSDLLAPATSSIYCPMDELSKRFGFCGEQDLCENIRDLAEDYQLDYETVNDTLHALASGFYDGSIIFVNWDELRSALECNHLVVTAGKISYSRMPVSDLYTLDAVVDAIQSNNQETFTYRLPVNMAQFDEDFIIVNAKDVQEKTVSKLIHDLKISYDRYCFESQLKSMSMTQTQFCKTLGLTVQGVIKWKKTGKYPDWLKYAMTGLGQIKCK